MQLFSMPDEWSLLKQRAWQTRCREAIRDRGLKLYDAFILFDSDGNGKLSAAELFGALEWLNLPGVTARDIMEFMWLADSDRDESISFGEFAQLLKVPEGEDSGDFKPNPYAIPEGMEHTQPKGEEELAKVRKAMLAEARQDEEEAIRIKAEEAETHLKDMKRHEDEAARKQGSPSAEWVTSKGSRYYHITFRYNMGDRIPKVNTLGDCTWMPNHLLLEKLAHLFMDCDLSVPTEGFSRPNSNNMPRQTSGEALIGAPLPLSRECSREAKAELAKLDVPPQPITFLRTTSVPTGNAGGNRINQYTITMEVKLPTLPTTQMPLFQTVYPNAEVGTLFVSKLGSFGVSSGKERPVYSPEGVKIVADKWHMISLTVDLLEGEVDKALTLYVDGKAETLTCQQKDITLDGCFSLRSRVCLFGGTNQKETDNRKGIKHFELHTTLLDKKQIQDIHSNRLVENMYQEMVRLNNGQNDFVDSALSAAEGMGLTWAEVVTAAYKCGKFDEKEDMASGEYGMPSSDEIALAALAM